MAKTADGSPEQNSNTPDSSINDVRKSVETISCVRAQSPREIRLARGETSETKEAPDKITRAAMQLIQHLADNLNAKSKFLQKGEGGDYFLIQNFRPEPDSKKDLQAQQEEVFSVHGEVIRLFIEREDLRFWKLETTPIWEEYFIAGIQCIVKERIL